MLDAKDLQAIAEIFDARLDAKLDEKLDPIVKRLDSMEKRLDSLETRMDAVEREVAKLGPIQKDLEELKIGMEEVRETANRLVGWADEVRDALPLPIPKL